jgi:hypothetical protein
MMQVDQRSADTLLNKVNRQSSDIYVGRRRGRSFSTDGDASLSSDR